MWLSGSGVVASPLLTYLLTYLHASSSWDAEVRLPIALALALAFAV